MTLLEPCTTETFSLSGETPVSRLGFGAMRITGSGIWGEPDDREAALDLLRRLPGLGVNFIDTADSYGPEVSEQLIREALHPYKGLIIATKGGLTRPGPSRWIPNGNPAYLRQCVQSSLKRLGVDRIDLWQLHRIDPRVPREDQFAVMRDMQQEGLIRYAGLSQVSIEEIEAARKVIEIATVQNLYNLADRSSEDVLAYCEANRIGFIPWFPLASGDLAKPGSKLADLAERKSVTPAQIALAWVLRKSPVMLPIPGTGKLSHLEENMQAAHVPLNAEEMRMLDQLGPGLKGGRV